MCVVCVGCVCGMCVWDVCVCGMCMCDVCVGCVCVWNVCVGCVCVGCEVRKGRGEMKVGAQTE